MRQILFCLLLTFLACGLVVSDACAKRFGGGSRGFGMMHANKTFAHAQRTPKIASAATAQKQINNNSRWRGALTGLLLGSVLTSLFMGHGVGGAVLSWLLVGVSIYLMVNFLRRRKEY